MQPIYLTFSPVSHQVVDSLRSPLRRALATQAPVTFPNGIWFTARHHAGLHVQIGQGSEPLAQARVWRSPPGPAAELTFAAHLRRATCWPTVRRLLYLEQCLAWAWIEV